MVVLLDITEKLYNARGITKNTTLKELQNLSSQDYPIFSDLYIFLEDYKKNITSEEELKNHFLFRNTIKKIYYRTRYYF